MISPFRLFGKWYICKDTTIPADYPPKARDMMVNYRLDLSDARQRVITLEYNRDRIR